MTARAGPISTREPAGLRRYLQGRSFDADWARTGSRTCERAYLKAIQIDPQFAPAYAALAACYGKMSLWSTMRPAEAAPLGLEAAMRAIELDRILIAPKAVWAFVRLNLMWDWPGAEVAQTRP
jgi:hypothetical protein